MKRITISVPVGLIDAANQIALVFGESSSDRKTFGAANWRDGNGNLYAASSALVADDYDLTAPLVPRFDADLALAGIAQDAIVIGATASPLHIAVIVGPHDADPMAQVTALGLTAVAQNDSE